VRRLPRRVSAGDDPRRAQQLQLVDQRFHIESLVD
jgi:hypothetical protein